MKKILFSPIGGTDPIANERDGSLLHMCRIYRPDKVFLFLSKEITDICIVSKNWGIFSNINLNMN